MSEPTPQECADWLSGSVPLHPNTVTAVRYFRELASLRQQVKIITPELLALIEAAREYSKPIGKGSWTGMFPPTAALHVAAIAFARTQDHPDAG